MIGYKVFFVLKRSSEMLFLKNAGISVGTQTKNTEIALAGVARWLEHHPKN